jgi:hypothetical protein
MSSYIFQYSGLTSINIPKAITRIGSGTFHTSQLASITFDDRTNAASVGGYYPLTIDSHAFNNTQLTKLILPEGTNYIDMYVAANNTKLEKVVLPNTLTGSYNAAKYSYNIGTYAFTNCTALTDVTFGDNIQSINNGMFQGCTSLGADGEEFVVPETVIYIGTNAFNGTGLRKIKILAKFMNRTTADMNAYIFDNCAELTQVTLPANTTKIGSGVFRNCPKLTTINLPDTLTEISGNAFENTALNNVVIPASVTKIAAKAFIGIPSTCVINVEAKQKEILGVWTWGWDADCDATFNWGYVAPEANN